jgi:N-acetylglucosamine-6-phosphate deacetylase
MIQLSDVSVVLPDRILSAGTVVVDGDRIVDVSVRSGPATSSHFRLPGHYVVPGFIDVHVHGVDGSDALEGGDVVRRIARQLPQFGVTAFCPTSIACAPAALRKMLDSVRTARENPDAHGARVLPAHLESNFINPDFKGAQPLDCLRLPVGGAADGEFTGADILAEIAAARPEVGIVTLAPELDGALDLVRQLVADGHHVSLGHSGATYEESLSGIEAGARQATHLFNRMTPLGHRAPGLAGAVLANEEVTAEIVCDGVHVHPAAVRIALAAKGPAGIMAITDGTSGSGRPRGSRASLGGRSITVGDVAYLDDGTIAGSVLTMDQAFRILVENVGIGIIDAATMCSTTPARALQLHGLGVIAPGAFADFVVLDPQFRVTHTCVGGRMVYGPQAAGS